MIQRSSLIVIALLLAVASSPNLLAEAVGREVTISDFDREKYLPAVAYNGDRQEFLVVWHDLLGSGVREVNAARLDRFGKVIATFTVASGATSRAQPAVAYDDVRDRYLVVYIYDYLGNGSDWDVRGRLIPWFGPDPGLTEFTIFDSADSQWNPKVVYSDGDDVFVVVWTNEVLAANETISGRFIEPVGTPQFAWTVAADATYNYLNPDLAYNPLINKYLVAYERNGVDIATRRFSAANVYEASQVMVAEWPDAEASPAVAACSGQNQWLVAWKNATPKIWARFLTGTGEVDGGPLDVLNTIAGQQREPTVGCPPGGNQYLVAWEQEYSGAVFGLFGRRVGTDKTFLAPAFTVRPVFGPQLRNAKTPAVVGGTIGWSVAWVQEREGSTYSDIHGSMVWSLFADDLETGNTNLWSAVAP